MSRSFIWNIFILLMTSVGFGQTLVSQVAGQAGDQVITTREVRINYFIETALFPDVEKPASPKIEITQSKFESEITRVLIEWVVVKEADVFKATPVPEDDITKSAVVVRQLAQKSENASYWEALSVTPTELKEMIGRKLRAKKFIQFKARASVVPVTDAEALQYFQKNRVRFGNAPFSDFKESIKSFLAQEQANSRIKDWFELLQKKYRVKKVAVNATPSKSR